MTTTLTVRKPKAILFDIIGTVTKTGFVDKVLFSYVRSNLDTYLNNNWSKKVLMRDIDLLRAEALQDGGPAIIRPSESPDRIRRSVVDYISKCMDENRDNEAIRIFRFHMIFDGYNRGHLQTSVYSDVAIGLGNWSTKENIKLYVYSNGWKYCMKKFLEKTNHANLALVVEEFMDTEMGPLDDAKSYEGIIQKLGFPAVDILFLTHSGVEGVAAHFAGLSVVLVTTHREELNRERTEETQKAKLPFIRSFNDLIFANDAPTASSMGSSVDYAPPSSSRQGSSSKAGSSAMSSGSAGSSSSSAVSGSSSKGSLSKSSSSGTRTSGSGSSLSGSTSRGSSGSSGSLTKGSSSTSASSTKGSSGTSASSTKVSSGTLTSSTKGSSSSSKKSSGASGSSGSSSKSSKK